MLVGQEQLPQIAFAIEAKNSMSTARLVVSAEIHRRILSTSSLRNCPLNHPSKKPEIFTTRQESDNLCLLLVWTALDCPDPNPLPAGFFKPADPIW